ncbi:MAG TPA: dihydrodipicolinate synthase family protein, partial [Egibacteraceae bacterium]|nr:dihydrodipicolinate synthase family protein [Egibacteraceae bacterium]
RPSQRGLLTHFATAAAATDLPVMLYDIPSRCAVEIAGDTLLRLAETVPNIRAVKDATGNFTKAARVAASAPDGFEIFSGDDAALLPLLAVGGVGVVSVAAHLVGRELADMIESFPTDPARSRRIHHRLLPLFSALFCDSNPVPLKAGLDLLGLPGGPVRLPLASADQGVIDTMRTTMTELGLLDAAER